jgi:hypothetical protein
MLGSLDALPQQSEIVDYHLYLAGTGANYTDFIKQGLDYLQKQFIRDYLWQNEPFQLQLWDGIKQGEKFISLL